MKKKRVKIGEWKSVFKGLIYELKQAEAVYSNGTKAIFEKAFRVPSVIILPVNDKRQVIMTKEYRLATKSYEWFLPVGRMDKGNDPKKEALRELEEEAGFTSKKLTLLYKNGNYNSLEHVNYVYVAQDLIPINKKEVGEDEDITLHPMSINKALKLVLDGEVNSPEICFALLKLNLYLKTKK